VSPNQDDSDAVDWVFGYGSLVWRPDFPFVERRAGFIEGWCRRFWQGSTDHRGLPEAPGRVATLAREAGGRCWGSAYRVSPDERARVLRRLDYRERGGFERLEVTVQVASDPPARAKDSPTRLRALAYIATPENPNYLGPAPLQAIVDQVRISGGPSGSNREYVLRLAESLREMGASDEHVFALAELLDRGDGGAER
jgi:cation transport protein ChaC